MDIACLVTRCLFKNTEDNFAIIKVNVDPGDDRVIKGQFPTDLIALMPLKKALHLPVVMGIENDRAYQPFGKAAEPRFTVRDFYSWSLNVVPEVIRVASAQLALIKHLAHIFFHEASLLQASRVEDLRQSIQLVCPMLSPNAVDKTLLALAVRFTAEFLEIQATYPTLSTEAAYRIFGKLGRVGNIALVPHRAARSAIGKRSSFDEMDRFALTHFAIEPLGIPRLRGIAVSKVRELFVETPNESSVSLEALQGELWAHICPTNNTERGLLNVRIPEALRFPLPLPLHSKMAGKLPRDFAFWTDPVTERVYPRDLWDAEQAIVTCFTRAASTPPIIISPEARCSEAAILVAAGLDGPQVNAVFGALAHCVTCITGGAGTGKTRVLAEIIRAFERRGTARLLVGCPTAKAAFRISRELGPAGSAATLHRLFFDERLHMNDSKDSNSDEDESNPEVQGVVLVVDEASMVNTFLLGQLIDRINRSTVLEHLVLVGDQAQLPPVEFPSVFTVFLQTPSSCIDVHHLDHLYRSEGRLICENGRDVRDYILNINPTPPPCQFDTLEFMRILPLGRDPTEQVLVFYKNHPPPLGQVLCFTNRLRGIANEAARATFNPPPAGTEDPKAWRIGDRVICKKNGNGGQVNGALGFIRRMTSDSVIVEWDDMPTALTMSKTHFSSYFELGYVITIHKAQGSEWPHLLLLFAEHSANLSAELFYTAFTRAQSSVSILTSPILLGEAMLRVTRGLRVSEALLRDRCLAVPVDTVVPMVVDAPRPVVDHL